LTNARSQQTSYAPESAYPDPLSADTPHFVALRTVFQLCSLARQRDLSLGRNDEAFAIFGLPSTGGCHPSGTLLVSAMIIAPFTAWPSIVLGRLGSDQWSDQQLEGIPKAICDRGFVGCLRSGDGGERAGVITCSNPGRPRVVRTLGASASSGVIGKKSSLRSPFKSVHAAAERDLLNYNLLLDVTISKIMTWAAADLPAKWRHRLGSARQSLQQLHTAKLSGDGGFAQFFTRVANGRPKPDHGE